MEYSVKGLKDTTYEYLPLAQSVSVQYASGDKSQVTLAVSGLPKGLDAYFTDSSGTPDFETTLALSHSDYIVAGTYPVNINAKSGNSTVKSASFNLSVTSSCGEFMSGNYTTDITYASSGEMFSQTQYRTTVKADYPNRLFFYEGKNTDPDFYGDIDCAAGTITIPAQTKPGSSLQYSGTGKLITKTHKLEFSIVYEGFPELKFSMTRL
jgi:hypothetical protein